MSANDSLAATLEKVVAERDAAQAQVAALRRWLAWALTRIEERGGAYAEAMKCVESVAAAAVDHDCEVRADERTKCDAAWLAAHEDRAREAGAQGALQWVVSGLLEHALFDGAKCDADTVSSALVEHDARVRAAALRQAVGYFDGDVVGSDFQDEIEAIRVALKKETTT